MCTYTLARNGDGFEQHYWSLFISSDFPAYARFWTAFVVPLTNRPSDIHFKDDSQLAREGLTQVRTTLLSEH